MRRNGSARKPADAAREWLIDLDGFIPRAWAPHFFPVSRQCIQKAIDTDRVERRTFRAPDGTEVELLRIADLEKLRSRVAA